jgi:NitT/TauT family transport system substrate-binding protein
VLLAMIATAVLALTLVSSAGGGARHTEAAVTPITIGGVFCTCHTNMYVAWKKGFFAKRGVPVKSYVLTQGGSLTVAGVLGGQFDFGATTLEAVVRSQALSTPLKAIANVYPEFWALTIRSDQRSSIRKISDLKGKTVGVSTIGSGSWAFLVVMLAKSGINANEVNIVQLGGLSNIVAALRAKRVDASVTWEPGTSAARRGGIGTAIVNLQIPGVSGKVFGSNVSMSQVLAARGDTINKSPAVATAVIAAIRDADNWLVANRKKPAEIVKVLKSVAPGTISTGTLLDAAKATLKVQPTSPRLSREGYDTSTKALVQSGSLRAQPFENVVDCRFAGCGP